MINTHIYLILKQNQIIKIQMNIKNKIKIKECESQKIVFEYQVFEDGVAEFPIKNGFKDIGSLLKINQIINILKSKYFDEHEEYIKRIIKWLIENHPELMI